MKKYEHSQGLFYSEGIKRQIKCAKIRSVVHRLYEFMFNFLRAPFDHRHSRLNAVRLNISQCFGLIAN